MRELAALFLGALPLLLGEVVAIWQVDTEKDADWLPWAFGYAWTNTYLVDMPDRDAVVAFADELTTREADCMWRWSEVQYAMLREGIGGPRSTDIIDYIKPGTRHNFDHYPNLFYSCRMVGYSGNRLVWYKRWRGPLNPDVDFSGELLTSAFTTLLTDTLLSWLMDTVGMVTRSGLPITSYGVDPRVYSWQLRDGQKRRRRSPLTHP